MIKYFKNIFENEYLPKYKSGIFHLDENTLAREDVLNVLENMSDDGTDEAVDYVKAKFKKSKIEKIVILGSGSGKLGDRLAKYYTDAQIIDIDKSPYVIERLKSKYKNNHLRVSLLGDAQNIPLDKNSVDLVVAYSLFRFVKNKNLVIKSISNILKGGGSAIAIESRLKNTIDEVCSLLESVNIKYNKGCKKNLRFTHTSFFYYLAGKSTIDPDTKNKILKIQQNRGGSFLENALYCAGKYRDAQYYVSWKKNNEKN